MGLRTGSRGQRSGVVKKKAAPQKVFASGDGPKTLVQKRKAAAMRSARRRALQRRPTNDVVDKIILDNFKGWGARVDTVLKSGLSLRQVLARDVRRRRDNEITMGKLYYVGLKGEFADADAASSAVWAFNESDPVDMDLKMAIMALKGAKTSNPQPLLNWLQQDGPQSEQRAVHRRGAQGILGPHAAPAHQAVHLDHRGAPVVGPEQVPRAAQGDV